MYDGNTMNHAQLYQEIGCLDQTSIGKNNKEVQHKVKLFIHILTILSQTFQSH